MYWWFLPAFSALMGFVMVVLAIKAQNIDFKSVVVAIIVIYAVVITIVLTVISYALKELLQWLM